MKLYALVTIKDLTLVTIREYTLWLQLKVHTSFQDQMYLTITLIAIVFSFLLGEIPNQLVSKMTTETLLCWTKFTEEQKIHYASAFNTLRSICTVLNAIEVSVNFLLYCIFCPIFRRAIGELFEKGLESNSKKKKKLSAKKSVQQINLFVIGGQLPEAEWKKESVKSGLRGLVPFSVDDGKCDEAYENLSDSSEFGSRDETIDAEWFPSERKSSLKP